MEQKSKVLRMDFGTRIRIEKQSKERDNRYHTIFRREYKRSGNGRTDSAPGDFYWIFPGCFAPSLTYEYNSNSFRCACSRGREYLIKYWTTSAVSIYRRKCDNVKRAERPTILGENWRLAILWRLSCSRKTIPDAACMYEIHRTDGEKEQCCTRILLRLIKPPRLFFFDGL